MIVPKWLICLLKEYKLFIRHEKFSIDLYWKKLIYIWRVLLLLLLFGFLKLLKKRSIKQLVTSWGRYCPSKYL